MFFSPIIDNLACFCDVFKQSCYASATEGIDSANWITSVKLVSF